MKTPNLLKIKREKMLETIKNIKKEYYRWNYSR